MADNINNDAHVAKRRHAPRGTPGRDLARAMELSEDSKTQSALAKKSGVAQSTIGRSNSSRSPPDARIVGVVIGKWADRYSDANRLWLDNQP